VVTNQRHYLRSSSWTAWKSPKPQPDNNSASWGNFAIGIAIPPAQAPRYIVTEPGVGYGVCDEQGGSEVLAQLPWLSQG